MLATYLVWAFLIYLLIGFVFSLFFITLGVKQIDEGAKGTSVGFRLMIMPGTWAFWPVLLSKWIKQRKK